MDIKTRDISRGTIKSLDRAASSMHRLKEQTIRDKTADIIGRQNDDSGQTYAQDTVEHLAGDSAAYASRASVDMLLRSREQGAASPTEIEGLRSPGVTDAPETMREAIGGSEQISRAFREQGVKNILDRRNRAKMAAEEALQDAEARGFADRMRITSTDSKVGSFRQSAGRIAKNRHKMPDSAKAIQDARKKHAMKRILNSREAGRQGAIPLFRIGKNNGRRTTRTVSSFLRFMWENAKTAVTTLGTGAAATVIILVLFVFFGIGMITFSNNSPDTTVNEETGEIEYFIPDLAGSPTRQAIVKAAAKKVGNVGGEKFWRWYGFKSHVHWCACFTSYIAAECGCIQSGICPKSALVDDWISFYKKQHRWAGRNYIPHSGDFILFDWEGDGSPDHIGIVEACDGKVIHTIEGNSRDVCKRKTYTVGSGFVYGFGCPNYSGR